MAKSSLMLYSECLCPLRIHVSSPNPIVCIVEMVPLRKQLRLREVIRVRL